MRLALNEVWNTALKASRGAGVGNGVAEDVADAVAWLCRHDFDGLAALVDALSADLPARAAVHEPAPGSPGKDAWRFPDARVVLAGPAALDLLTAGLADSVDLEHPDSPVLLLGLAGAEAERRGRALEMTRGDDAPVTLTPHGVALAAVPGDAAAWRLRYVDWRAAGSALELDVDRTAASAADALARRILVPSSAASEARGAGDGSTNNLD